jgi:hypothetical protein
LKFEFRIVSDFDIRLSNFWASAMDKTRIPVKLHRRVALIQTEDAVLAEEILAQRKLAQDIVGRLADRVLLVRAGRTDSVVQELRNMGHTPQVVG